MASRAKRTISVTAVAYHALFCFFDSAISSRARFVTKPFLPMRTRRMREEKISINGKPTLSPISSQYGRT